MNIFEKLKQKYPHLKHDDTTDSFISYESLLFEYKTFRNSAVVYYAKNHPVFLLTGSDSIDFLNRISTNNIKILENNSVTTSLLLNEKGKFIDKITLYKLNDSIILSGSSGNTEKISRWLNKYVLSEDVHIKNISNDYGYFRIFGKKAEAFATLLFGNQISQVQLNKIKFFPYDLNVYLSKILLFRQITCYDIFSPVESTEKFLSTLIENLDFFDCSFIGSHAFEILRIEYGFPKFPNEINLDINPLEVEMLSFINGKKNNYIGHEVIASLSTKNNLQKKLHGIIFSENIEIEAEQEIYLNDEVIGFISSSVFSPKLVKRIGLCFIYQNSFEKINNHLIYVLFKNQKYEVKIVNLPILKYENIH